ncbi:MAG: 4-alpha-glucanotransferase, partial [Actinomycetota bacterium]
MGADSARPPDPRAWVVSNDRPVRLGDDVTIRLEAGGEVRAHGDMPPDTPLGYHTLVHPDEREHPLIVSPGACFLPDDLRTWGWGAQLYSVRSSDSWGLGDFGDLRGLGWLAGLLGGGVVFFHPLPSTPLPAKERKE